MVSVVKLRVTLNFFKVEFPSPQKYGNDEWQVCDYHRSHWGMNVESYKILERALYTPSLCILNMHEHVVGLVTKFNTWIRGEKKTYSVPFIFEHLLYIAHTIISQTFTQRYSFYFKTTSLINLCDPWRTKYFLSNWK